MDHKSSPNNSKRLLALAGFLSAALVIYVGVLYNIQVNQHDYYLAKSIRTITRVDETTITYTKDGAEHTIRDADTLVFAVGYTPAPLPGGEKIHRIGDCDKVGNLKDAISAAYELAKNL